tara:strand:- start:1465 stop:1689 length:225 start_codon:yes stop_codon:yes gene_type:complete
MNEQDRVKINFGNIPEYFEIDESNPEGVEGVVTSIDNGGEENDFKILVAWDNGADNAYDESHLIIINNGDSNNE